MYDELSSFYEIHGHTNVPEGHDNQKLCRWTNTQRKALRKTQASLTLSAERKERLDALGFKWDRWTTNWDKGFEHLEDYAREHGHRRVPSSYKSPDGFALGRWVGGQRRWLKTSAIENKQLRVGKRRKLQGVSVQRKSRLDALGFDWTLPRGSITRPPTTQRQ